MNNLEILGTMLIIFGIIGIIGTGYSYTLGAAADAQQIMRDSSAILERYESSVRSTGQSIQGIGGPVEKTGGSLRDAGKLINAIPFVDAGQPLIDAGELLFTVGSSLNKTGSDLVETGDEMKALAENLTKLSYSLVTLMNLALIGVGLMSIMSIFMGLGFREIGSDRDEIHQLRQEIDELKRG
ncbi:hypothetical protein [Methanocalculus sp. MSAO_Arc2]|uniref:hypothetical protein n=1 Tax=Methanocalculus sp. MSAO_Arc2 TaxID=2293855 RepID=UPI0026B40A8D